MAENINKSMKMRRGLALALCPKFTALLSIFGSSCLIYVTARDLIQYHQLSPHEQRRRSSGGRRNSTRSSGGGQQQQQLTKPTYSRFVLGLSIGDLMASTAWFLTTWPIPSDTPERYGVSWNVGNQYTCSAQGFFTQFSFVAVAYNLNLSIYYVLVVVYSWKHEQLVKLEPYLHAMAILFSLGSAIVMAVLGMYNQSGWDCWITPKPVGCQESWDYNPAQSATAPNCERGDNAILFRFIFYYGPLWIAIVVIIVLMVVLVRYVQAIERKVGTHSFAGNRNQSNRSNSNIQRPRKKISQKICTRFSFVKKKKSRRSSASASASASGNSGDVDTRDYSRRRNLRKVKQSADILRQALYYVAAFIVTWIFSTIFQITYMVYDNHVIYALLFLEAFLIPIQGALNLIVYLRPRYIKYRAAQKKRAAVVTVASPTTPPPVSSSERDDPEQEQEQSPYRINNNKWCHSCQKLFRGSAVIAWFYVLGLELGLIIENERDNKKESLLLRGARGRNNTAHNNSSSIYNNNNSNNNSSAFYGRENSFLHDSIKDHITSLEIIEDNSNDDEGEDNSNTSDNEIRVDYVRERNERMCVDSTRSNISVAANDDDYQVHLNGNLKVDDDGYDDDEVERKRQQQQQQQQQQ